MGITYEIGNALSVLGAEPPDSAEFVYLDDAWARPNRHGGFGVDYPTHPFDEQEASKVEDEPGVETSLSVRDMLDASTNVVRPGGILAVDVDDYLLPKVVNYFKDEWSPTSFAIAQTVSLTNAGEPDQSTPGMYCSTGGYSTILAWHHASPVPRGHPLREHHTLHCPCQRQREDYGWGTVKPLAPFEQWLDAYTKAGDRILCPCAGTAPAAIAAEKLYGDETSVLCVDIEPEAKEAYQRRRRDELNFQQTLSQWG